MQDTEHDGESARESREQKAATSKHARMRAHHHVCSRSDILRGQPRNPIFSQRAGRAQMHKLLSRAVSDDPKWVVDMLIARLFAAQCFDGGMHRLTHALG